MRKLLLLCTCVWACVLGAWATPTAFGTGSSWEIDGTTLSIYVGTRGDLASWGTNEDGTPSLTGLSKVEFTGTIYSKYADNSENGSGSDGEALKKFKDLVVDLRGATMPITTFWNQTGIVIGDASNYPVNIIVPSAYANDPSTFPALQAYGAISSNDINLYSISGLSLKVALGDLNKADFAGVKGSCTTLEVYNFSSGDLKSCGFTTIDFTNTTLTGSTTVPTGATVYVNTTAEKTYITGTNATNVQARFNGTATVAAGGNLGSNISTALSGYEANNNLPNITTLIITGELTATDVEWLNTNKNNLTGLTSVNLTGLSSFGSGVSKSTIEAALPSGVTVTYPALFYSYDSSTAITTITVLNAGNATAENLTSAGVPSSVGQVNNQSTIKVVGTVNSSDITNIVSRSNDGWKTIRLDFSEATVTDEIPRISGCTGDNSPNDPYFIILPPGTASPTEDDVAYYSNNSRTEGSVNGIYNDYDDLQYIIIPAAEANGHAKIFVNKTKNSPAVAAALQQYDIDLITANNPSVIDVYNLDGAFDDASFATLKSAIDGLTASGEDWEGKPIVYHASSNPLVVTGCNVTIDMNEAGSKSLATLISEAYTAVVTEGGQSNICSLTVSGPLNAADITALNTELTSPGGKLHEITYLNLGGATGMAQSDVDAIVLPSTLTRLTIPSDRVVTSTLHDKAVTNGKLDYIYSPSSDSQHPGVNEESLFDDTKNLSPDYVWVVKAGGLASGFTNEEQLRNSYYIKVASSVALNTTDVNFDGLGNKKPSNYLFLDFSDSNLTPAMAANYTVTDDIGYRIILPNNWTGDQMAVFAANEHRGSLAAVYSYHGTTLKILEITDASYSQSALANPRIVRSGTTEVDVISGTYNGVTYSQFGDNLLAALNNMGKSPFTVSSTNYTNTVGLTVTTISIETGANVPNAITFDNPTITTLSMRNVGQGWSSLNVDACSSLQTLDLSHINLGNTSAKVASLTSVDLSGATVNGTADFSGAALTTAFTMDDDTSVTSDLSLKSTGLTSFIPMGTVGGNIYLNASSSLASLDVRQVNITGTNKKIHIDNTAEETTTSLTSLHVSDAIIVPTDYVVADHIHPADDITDAYIKRQAYIPPMYTTSATTIKLHEKNEGGDDDNFIYWYDDTTVPGSNITIGTSSESGHSLSDILTDKFSEINFTGTTYRRAKISGPITATDVASLVNVNGQVLDLSDATFDEAAWNALKAAFKTSGTNVHSNVRFIIMPDTCSRESIINGEALAGLSNVLSVVSLNKITGAEDTSENGTNLTSWNRVSGALQAAVVAAGNRSCQSWTKTPDGKTSRNIYTSDISDFRVCKISGLINSHDLSKANQQLDENGHLSWDEDPVELSSGTDPRQLDGEYTVYGPFGSSFLLSEIDLKEAYFEEWDPSTYDNSNFTRYYASDMTLSTLGIISTGTYKVVIPQDTRVNEVPADFMNCSTNIRAICIPSNIRVIRTRAFYTIDYVWTTPSPTGMEGVDPEGDNTRLDNGAKLSTDGGTTYVETSALIYENGAYKENPDFTKAHYVADYSTINGGGSYTFGSNLRMIETAAFANTQPNVKDVYVLNTTAPECHVDAFNTVMYAGNNGYSPISGGQKIISRENYFNGRWITLLHYPRQTTTPNVQRYTDPTREYSIATGERDGKGAPIYFPNQSEFIRAYNQGTYGYLWNAWNPEREYGSVTNPMTDANSGWKLDKQADANDAFNKYTAGINHEYTSFYKVNWDGVSTTVASSDIVDYYNVYWNESSYSQSGTEAQHLYPQSEVDANNDIDNSGEKTAKDYRGWHQFVLTAYAANTVLKEEPLRSYIGDNEWWTICPQINITRAEAALLYGEVTYDTSEGTWTTTGEIPYISRLLYVTRDYTEENPTISLCFSKNLMTYKENRTTSTESGTTIVNTETSSTIGGVPQHGEKDATTGIVTVLDDTSTGANDVVMSAGVPYLIRPNLPVGGTRQFRILASADEYEKLSEEDKTRPDVKYVISASLYNKIKDSQVVPGETQMATMKTGLYTVPVFVKGDAKQGVTKETVDGTSYTVPGQTDSFNKSSAYEYTFVGTYYNSYLPQNCYFLGWKWTNAGKTTGKAVFYYNHKADYDNFGWANETGIICPTIPSGFSPSWLAPASGLEAAQWKIDGNANATPRVYGLKDDSFDITNPSSAKAYNLVIGAESIVTAISEVTVDDDTTVGKADGRVYNMNGQEVGSSVNGLTKGLYIVNGKKYVVK